jgi:nucleoside-diphosphate-sugar epimerase
MVAAATAPNINGLVINVGSGIETSVRDLINKVLTATGSETNVIYNQKIAGGVSNMRADLTLASKKLNFKPSISLEDGLRLTLKRDTRLKKG